MKALLALFLILLLQVHGDDDLAALRGRIAASHLIDTTSVGSYVVSKMSSSLHTTSVSLSNCTYSLTPTLLTVQCTAKIWSTPVASTWYFYKVSGQINMAVRFATLGSLSGIYHFVSGQQPPSYFANVAGSHWNIGVATSDGAPGNVAMGVTFQGVAVINGTLLAQYQKMLPTENETIFFSANCYLPIFGGPDPEDLTLSIWGSFPLTKHLEATYFAMVVTDANGTMAMEVESRLTVGILDEHNQIETIAFDVSAAVGPGDVTLKGSLVGMWKEPYDIKWMNITEMDVTLVLGSNPRFSIDKAIAVVDWHKDPIDVLLTIGGANFDEVLVEAYNIPLSHTVKDIFKFITGVVDPALDQLVVSGTAAMALSSYNGKFQKGFTLEFDASVTQGPISNAVSKLKKDANFVYTFSMFVSIFSPEALNVDLTLLESNAFFIDDRIKCEHFTITLDFGNDNTDFKIDAQLDITLHDTQVLGVDANMDLNENSGLQFKGTTTTPWNKPIGIKWLNLDAGATIMLKLGSIDNFQLHGTGTLDWVPGSQVSLDVVIGGPDFSQCEFAISNIPIKTTTLDKIIHDITGRSISQINSMHPQGVATVEIANFDNAQGPSGFSLRAKVTVENDGSDLYKALAFLRNDVNTLVFDLMLDIQLFQTPMGVSFDLTENGAFKLNKRITVNNYGLHVEASEQAPEIKINADMDVAFTKQSEVLNFDVSADWRIPSNLNFQGTMTGQWKNPFGCKWLVIDQVQLSLGLSAQQAIASFDISGQGTFVWGTDHGTAQVSLSTSEDFTVDTLSATITNQWTIVQIAETIAGNGISKLISDIEVKENLDIHFSLSTESGVTFSLDGSVTGELADTFHKYRYWLPNKPGDSFSFFLTIPIFSSTPIDITVGYSEVENFRMGKHINMTSYSFSIATYPLAVSLDAQMIGTFNKQPPLTFEVNGKFGVDLGVTLWGDMLGTWENAFGFKGFDLSNVIGEIGFSPAACAYGCVSDFGIGCAFNIGRTEISFDGNVAVPDMWNMYLAGSISKKSPQQTLGVWDVADKWNTINPNNKVDDSLIPKDWHMNSASFYLAPEDGQFGPIHYIKGFGVSANIQIISMDVYFSLNCSGDTYTCDFAFDCTIDIHTVTEMIKHEILLMYPDLPGATNATWTIFSIHDVQLTQWSQKNSANGVEPRWTWDLTVFNKRQTLDFRVRQYELTDSFHKFFVQWLKHLF